MCGGLWWFVVVCGGLWWFVVDCGGLSFSHTRDGARKCDRIGLINYVISLFGLRRHSAISDINIDNTWAAPATFPLYISLIAAFKSSTVFTAHDHFV